MQLFEREFDFKIYENILSNGKGQSKNCIKSAFVHLEKAFLLQDVDKEMAIFRAITAEEEAATAIFLLLKEKSYANAKKIKFKSHVHKQALNPFIKVLSHFFSKIPEIAPFFLENKFQLEFEGEGKDEKLCVSYKLGDKRAYPQPPLHFSFQINNKPYFFESELNEFVANKEIESVISYVKELANRRNDLLYANSAGVPSISGDITAYLKNKVLVFARILRIYALIYPYKEKANFVQQSLDSFLIMLGELDKYDDLPQA